MFFKIAVLKYFSFTVKKTHVLECLFNTFAGLYDYIFHFLAIALISSMVVSTPKFLVSVCFESITRSALALF